MLQDVDYALCWTAFRFSPCHYQSPLTWTSRYAQLIPVLSGLALSHQLMCHLLWEAFSELSRSSYPKPLVIVISPSFIIWHWTQSENFKLFFLCIVPSLYWNIGSMTISSLCFSLFFWFLATKNHWAHSGHRILLSTFYL